MKISESACVCVPACELTGRGKQVHVSGCFSLHNVGRPAHLEEAEQGYLIYWPLYSVISGHWAGATPVSRTRDQGLDQLDF